MANEEAAVEGVPGVSGGKPTATPGNQGGNSEVTINLIIYLNYSTHSRSRNTAPVWCSFENKVDASNQFPVLKEF